MVTMDKLNSTDHDLLITLHTKLESFIAQYHIDMKGLHDGVTQQLADHSATLKIHEKMLDEHQRVMDVVKPEKTLEDYLGLKQRVNDFFTTAKAYRLAAGAIGGFITYLLTQVPSLLRFLGIL